jgi:hypothetical protein
LEPVSEAKHELILLLYLALIGVRPIREYGLRYMTRDRARSDESIMPEGNQALSLQWTHMRLELTPLLFALTSIATKDLDTHASMLHFYLGISQLQNKPFADRSVDRSREHRRR